MKQCNEGSFAFWGKKWVEIKKKKKTEAEETLRTLRRDLSVLNPIPIPLIEIISHS